MTMQQPGNLSLRLVRHRLVVHDPVSFFARGNLVYAHCLSAII